MPSATASQKLEIGFYSQLKLRCCQSETIMGGDEHAINCNYFVAGNFVSVDTNRFYDLYDSQGGCCQCYREILGLQERNCRTCNQQQLESKCSRSSVSILKQKLNAAVSFRSQLMGQYCRLKTIISILVLLALIGSLGLTEAKRFSGTSPSSFHARKRYRSDLHWRQDKSECETLQIPMCNDLGYNQTDVTLSPANIFIQSDANEKVMQFGPVIRANCAEEMKLLVCAIYAPICMPSYPKFLPPCRFICERAKKGCGPLLEKYRVPWPPPLNCDNFPEFSRDNQLCLHFNQTRNPSDDVRPALPSNAVRPTVKKAVLTEQPSISATLPGSKHRVPKVPQTVGNSCLCDCISPMVSITSPNDPLYNQVWTGGVRNCAMPCKSPYFTEERRKSAEAWITAWSVVCFIVTFITVLTFLIDTDRFKYPERPIINLSVCYMFVSVGFLIRVIAGHEAVACAHHSDRVLYNTTGPFLCSVVFILLYFFGMAGALWWVILSLTWFLAAGLKWGSEAIASYSPYYHVAAWLFPALKSITVLAMSKVDGDSLSGICYVGHQNNSSLLGFVLAPLLVYLVLGGLFLFLGFLNLFRIRTSIKKVGKKTNTLERLMGRIGLFSLLYMIPSAALVASYFYEYQNRDSWAKAYNCRAAPNGTRCPYPLSSRPEFAVFIVKYSMTLVIGITNVVWICTGKTLTSWKKSLDYCETCVCGSNVIVSWFKKRNMKSNVNTESSEISEDVSHVLNNESIERRERLDEVKNLNEGGSDSKYSALSCSRDDTTAKYHHGVDEKVTDHECCGEVSRKSMRRKTGYGRSSSGMSGETRNGLRGCERNGNCANKECCEFLRNSVGQQVVSPSAECADGAHHAKSLSANYADEHFNCCGHSKRSSLCLACQRKPCTVTYTCHAAKHSVCARPLSRQLSSQMSTVPTNNEVQSYYACCDQSVAFESKRRPVSADVEPGSGRVQHIHHHHHLHHGGETPCECQKIGYKKAALVNHGHSSHDSGASNLLIISESCKFCMNSPVDRCSLIT